MLSLVSQVEQDLRAIANESRRKFPEVKEAAERALLRLRSTVDALPKDATAAQQAASVAEAEEDQRVPARSPWPPRAAPRVSPQDTCSSRHAAGARSHH